MWYHANYFEPKLLSIINSILIKKQEFQPYHFGILEYSYDESYFATIKHNSFNFINLDITRSDKVLLKQIENMENPDGPFGLKFLREQCKMLALWLRK